MRISDWSSDVCSSDLLDRRIVVQRLGDVGHRTPGEDPERVSGAGGMRRLDDRLRALGRVRPALRRGDRDAALLGDRVQVVRGRVVGRPGLQLGVVLRSEEHTSELQSLMRISYAVFCLKKKNY